MKNILIYLIISFFVTSQANANDKGANVLSASNKVWVFAQFNVPQEDKGLETYYYYAHIDKKMYTAISQNEMSDGFILLEKVKYWGNDDLIYEYKGIENSGNIVFRIENIVKLNLINIEPVAGKGEEQFEAEVL